MFHHILKDLTYYHFYNYVDPWLESLHVFNSWFSLESGININASYLTFQQILPLNPTQKNSQFQNIYSFTTPGNPDLVHPLKK